MGLCMWSNEVDYVVAESADEAKQIVSDHYGCGDEDLGIFEEEAVEKEFTLRMEDGTKITKLIADWVKERGKGYFACTEY